MAYGYQYIPTVIRDDRRRHAWSVRVGGPGYVHPLDRAAAAIAEAIAAVYRDIDDLRRTVPELASAQAPDRPAETDTRS